ncbi:MAG: helix-turn-helix domain-containing protein [Methanocella sp.]
MSKKPDARAGTETTPFAVEFKNCPIEVAIGVLGKKWTLLVLRDIALLKINRFNRIRRSLPGLTSRVLILRLHELEEYGLIEAVVIKEKPRVVEWGLTEKGEDTVPILLSIMSFGGKWYADEVFYDGQARTIDEIYPGQCKAGKQVSG